MLVFLCFISFSLLFWLHSSNSEEADLNSVSYLLDNIISICTLWIISDNSNTDYLRARVSEVNTFSHSLVMYIYIHVYVCLRRQLIMTHTVVVYYCRQGAMSGNAPVSRMNKETSSPKVHFNWKYSVPEVCATNVELKRMITQLGKHLTPSAACCVPLQQRLIVALTGFSFTAMELRHCAIYRAVNQSHKAANKT